VHPIIRPKTNHANTVYANISACRKVSKFKIPAVSREEILGNRKKDFDDRLVGIYARGNLYRFPSIQEIRKYFSVTNFNHFFGITMKVSVKRL
jgi:hypothetical protein